jgi:hypothetical protein
MGILSYSLSLVFKGEGWGEGSWERSAVSSQQFGRHVAAENSAVDL